MKKGNGMRRIILALIFMIGVCELNAQMYNPVKWSFETTKVSDNVFELHFTAKIEKGWHLYSQDNNPNEGPVPLTFTFDKVSGAKLEGKVKELTKAVSKFDPNFDMQVNYFAKEASFSQQVKTSSSSPKIKGVLNFMVCNDSMCLPPKDVDFEFSFNAASDKATTPTKDNKNEKPIIPEKGNGGSSLFVPEPSSDSNTETAALEIIRPVSWTYEAKSLGNNEYELRFKANIKEGYHIYGLDKYADGPIPTAIALEDNANIKTVEAPVAEKDVAAVYDDIFDLDLKKYSGDVVFTQKIVLEKPINEIKGHISWQACDDTKCIAPEEVNFGIPIAGEQVAVEANNDTIESHDSFFSLFGKGFGWGLITLITPCVFPMIPLTVSFFTKRSEGRKSNGVQTAMIFGISIIAIYVALGILISLVFGADALNGMASNVYINLAFFVIFMIFAFSFFGAFDLSLPASWTNKADANSEKSGIIGVFFMAFTLTLVSFSCTGPFIGSLLVMVSHGNGIIGPIFGMGGFAVAFAMPFVIFAIFPAWMQKLPKSGGWLNSVKVVFGFVELAFALKFLSAVDLAYHWGILKREYFLALWIVIAILLGFYLLGKLKFSHDTNLSHISVPRLLLAIVSFAFAAYMVPGLWGAPVSMLSGLAPPLQYNEGFIPTLAVEGSGTNVNSQPVVRKYGEIFKSPNGLAHNTYFDYEEGLKAAQKEGKPLMLDFTGWSCSNCRKMEQNVWETPEVMQRLKNDFILVSLYVDDKTSLPEHEYFYSKVFDRKITTIGGKWGDLEASRYGTNAQPLYVILDHSEQQLIKPKGYDLSVEKFVSFLDNAKEEFKKRQQSAFEQVAQQ